MQATEQYIDPVEPSYPEKLLAIWPAQTSPRSLASIGGSAAREALGGD
jgi:hypothetical protein